MSYTVHLKFEEIKLPPFEEVLILGKNSTHGKLGLSKSFELLEPNGYEIIEVDHEIVEAVYINKKILKKIQKNEVIRILRAKVFPYVSEGELIKVEFKVSILCSATENEPDY